MNTLAEARVDLAAVRANVATLGEHAPGAQVLAAVKADGYGHGMVQVARAALQGGATWLGCAYVDEALALRAAGIAARVLAWIVPPGQQLGAAIREGIDLAAGTFWLVGDIAAAAREAGRPARVHLKADTGLSRGGATAAEWPRVLDAALTAQAEGLIDVVGVMSHLARADEPGDPSISSQIGHFREAVELAEKAGVRPEVRHLCNSAGTLSLPEAHFDLVRPGISVYGLSPFAPPELARPQAYGLRPAMTLSATVAIVKRVPAGSGVSYGHRYVTDSETTLALVPVGYADGIPRAASNTADVLLAGRRRRIAGTVCMDQFVLDVGNDDVRAGDRAVLFGPGDHGEPTAQDWAAALGTISWEVVTRVGARVPRVYEGSV